MTTRSPLRRSIGLPTAPGAPINWSDEQGGCLTNEDGDDFCWFHWPHNIPDIFWLLLGGLLVGLGAPFWAKKMRPTTEVRNAPKEIAKILKPEARQGSTQGQQMTTPTDEKPFTTEVFEAAAAGE